MRKVICDAGNFQVNSENPLSVDVTDATGLKMPFDGALIVSSMSLDPDLDAAGMSDFLYFSYRHTAIQKVGGPELSFKFPNLKTAENNSFKTEKNYLCFVEQDSMLIEYAGNSFHIGDEANDEGVIDNPILGRHEFGTNVINSCYARVLIYEFDNTALANELKQLGPIHMAEGTLLATELADILDVENINLPDTFQMHAFDLSGMATDCASSLRNIGVERNIDRPDLPDGKLLVQFVDLHGNPLVFADFPLINLRYPGTQFNSISVEINDTPLPMYTCDLPLQNKFRFTKTPEAEQDEPSYLYDDLHIAIWPGRDDKFKKINGTVEFDIYADITKEYLKHRFIRFCVFHPSQMFQTKVGGTILSDPPVPVQPTLGDPITTYRFNESRLNYFSDRNKVEIFNSPVDFFKDLEKTVDSLKSTDHLYQLNWITAAHVHLKGTAAARGLNWEMKNISFVEDSVQDIKDDIQNLGSDMTSFPTYEIKPGKELFFSSTGNDQTGNGSPEAPFATVTHLNTLIANNSVEPKTTLFFKRGEDFSGTTIVSSEIPELTFRSFGDPTLDPPLVDGKTFEDKWDFLNIPGTRGSRETRNNVYQIVMKSVATAETPSKELHSGFVRPLNLPSIPFKRGSSPLNSLVKGYYKLPTRAVINHTTNIPLELPNPGGNQDLLPFSAGFFRLGLTEGVLPKAKIIRNKTYAEIRTTLNLMGNQSLHLLVFNPKAGTHHFFELDHSSGIDQENQDLEEVGLGEASIPDCSFSDMFHAGDIAYAAIINTAPNADMTFGDHLLTAFRTYTFPNESHESGNIPLHEGESASLFRKAISRGVDVRTIYWEQSVAGISPSETEYQRGDNNNVKMMNIINNTIVDSDPNVNNKRGYAILDRATRQQGSFHQKVTVIVRSGRAKIAGIDSGDVRVSVLAYVGGIDIADGRWDGRFHHDHDPDRPSETPWYDAHVKITGDAAYDLLRNFKHRMDGIKKFALDADPNAIALDNCAPRFLGDVLNYINAGKLDIHIPKDSDIPEPARAGVETMVQINRTIPPYSCHVAVSTQDDEELVLDDKGELGILASYHQVLNNARKFVLINDQYFMNTELAALLHDRLTDPTSPIDFAIILLPRVLGENEAIDPVLYKARTKAMTILLHGYQENADFTNLGLDSALPDADNLSKPTCGKYIPEVPAADDKGIADKVVFLSPINEGTEKSQNVYVHSKHMIVDDVWMTIGSANMGARSMTYDWEINANMVDLKLHKGGTMAVRNQRIEILARMIGIPPAYSAVFQDPYASFKLLKAIEKNGNKNIHPESPAVKKLPIDYTPFEPGPFVANLDVDSPALTWVVCNVLDPDGRNQTGDRIGYFVQMFGIGKHPVDGGLNIIVQFEDASQNAIRQLITSNPDVRLSITTSITTFEDPNNPITSEPIEIERFGLELIQEDDPVDPDPDDDIPAPDPLPPVIRLRGNPSNNFYLAVSAANAVVVTGTIMDGNNAASFTGTIDMQPNGRVGIDFDNIDINEEVNEYPPNFSGETINRTLVIAEIP